MSYLPQVFELKGEVGEVSRGAVFWWFECRQEVQQHVLMWQHHSQLLRRDGTSYCSPSTMHVGYRDKVTRSQLAMQTASISRAWKLVDSIGYKLSCDYKLMYIIIFS